MATKKLPTKIFKVTYTRGLSQTRHEIEIRGCNTTITDSASDLGGTWEITDARRVTLFCIPFANLIECVVESAKPQKIRPTAVVPLKIMKA